MLTLQCFAVVDDECERCEGFSQDSDGGKIGGGGLRVEPDTEHVAINCAWLLVVRRQLKIRHRAIKDGPWGGGEVLALSVPAEKICVHNIGRYQRELGKLTEASADLADKTVALKELEVVLDRERESAKQLGGQVKA